MTAEPMDSAVYRVAQSIRALGFADEVDGTDEQPELSDVCIEQHALVAMIAIPDAIRDHVAAGVEPRDFVVPAHQLLYATILALWDVGGRPVDLLHVHHALAGKKTYEDIGGKDYLYQLIEGCFVVSTLHAPSWSRLVHELAQRRKLAGMGPDVARAAAEAPDLQGAVAQAQAILAERVRETGVVVQSPHSRDILAAADEEAGAYPVPWDALNFYTGGLEPGQVWSLIGTSSHGKTALALNIVHNALRLSQKVAYFNLDSHNRYLLYRLIALDADISRYLARQKRPSMSAESQRAWASRHKFTEGVWADAYKTYSLFRDLSRILAEARRHKMQYGLDLLVLDFIQNVSVGGHGATSEYETITSSMKAFQQFAQVEECVVMLLSQTSIEQQKGARPTDALNAKGGGVVKDVSDVCLSLFRDRFADDLDARHVMEVTVLKAKEHSNGRVALWMNFDTGRMEQRPDHCQSRDYLDWKAEQFH